MERYPIFEHHKNTDDVGDLVAIKLMTVFRNVHIQAIVRFTSWSNSTILLLCPSCVNLIL